MDIICNQESGSQRAIQYAIDALPADGGRVIVPSGNWESGPLRLRSNVELHLETGAEIWFSSDPSDYLPPVQTRQAGIECMSFAPLVYADHADHITISGKGTFHGKGSDWFQTSYRAYRMLRQESAFHTPVEDRLYIHQKAAIRPSFFEFSHSHHILLKEFHIEDSPQQALHLLYSAQIRVVDVTFHESEADGIYVDSSQQVQIEGCHFFYGRNGVIIGAGWREDGLKVNRPCSGTELRHCYFDHTRTALTIGPCLGGGIDHLNIRRCTVHDADCGLLCHLPSNAGGSLEDCAFEYLNIHDSRESAVCVSGQPMTCAFTAPRKTRKAAEKPPHLERLQFHTIFGARNARDCEISGLTSVQQEALLFDDVAFSLPKTDYQLVQSMN